MFQIKLPFHGAQCFCNGCVLFFVVLVPVMELDEYVSLLMANPLLYRQVRACAFGTIRFWFCFFAVLCQ